MKRRQNELRQSIFSGNDIDLGKNVSDNENKESALNNADLNIQIFEPSSENYNKNLLPETTGKVASNSKQSGSPILPREILNKSIGQNEEKAGTEAQAIKNGEEFKGKSIFSKVSNKAKDTLSKGMAKFFSNFYI